MINTLKGLGALLGGTGVYYLITLLIFLMVYYGFRFLLHLLGLIISFGKSGK